MNCPFCGEKLRCPNCSDLERERLALRDVAEAAARLIAEDYDRCFCLPGCVCPGCRLLAALKRLAESGSATPALQKP